VKAHGGEDGNASAAADAGHAVNLMVGVKGGSGGEGVCGLWMAVLVSLNWEFWIEKHCD
jgi:hypothetical protein